MLCAFAFLFFLGSSFEHGSERPRPILLVVGLLIAASVAAFCGLVNAIKVGLHDRDNRNQLLWVIVSMAVSTRLVALFTCPILEIDYYRYLWDGKVLCEGVSPYQHSPSEIRELNPSASFAKEKGNEKERLAQLSIASPSNHTILSRIHYSDYTTIYPPISQLVFASTVKWIPKSASVKAHITAIKLAFLLFDLGTLFLVFLLIRALDVHVGWMIAYAWNPLVIKEIANSGHLDSIATFFLTLSIFAFVRWQTSETKSAWWLPLWSGIALGLGVGAKLFPAVLFPALLVAIARRSWTKAGLFAIAFAVVSLVSLWPMFHPSEPNPHKPNLSNALAMDSSQSGTQAIDSGNERTSRKVGVVGFFSRWRMNDPVFSTLYLNLKSHSGSSANDPWFVVTSQEWRERLLQSCRRNRIGSDDPAFLLTKFATLSLFAVFYLWQLIKIYQAQENVGSRENDFMNRCTWIMAVFLFLQPTVNPWYFVWVAPLFCLSNNRGWLLVSGTLMIYYSRFWFKSLTGTFELAGCTYSGIGLFDHIVVWGEFGLIAGILAACFFLRSGRRATSRPSKI